MASPSSLFEQGKNRKRDEYISKLQEFLQAEERVIEYLKVVIEKQKIIITLYEKALKI